MFDLFSITTIAICLTLLVLAILSIISDTFLRKIRKGDDVDENDVKPQPVSVVIISDNNANEISRNLPVILEQNYPAGFEVIVVLCKDEDGTKDTLKAFRNYENLRVTFVPDSSRYMSIHKLAITLGVKAAKNDCVLLTDASCRPKTEDWIQSMASRFSNACRMVAGYSVFDDEATSYQTFSNLRRIYTSMNEASKGHPYSAPGKNLMFSKSMFMQERGFLGNLKYLRGEYDFLVNKYGEVTDIAVNTTAEAALEECAPTRREWHNANMFYAETRKHLTGRHRHRFCFNADMLFFYAGFLAAVGSAVFAVLTEEWIILPFSAITLIGPFVSRILTAKRASRCFDTPVSLWKVIPFELGLIFNNAINLLRYKFADEYEFISHKS